MRSIYTTKDDLGAILSTITYPMLLLWANPGLGGMMTDRVVQEVLTKSPTALPVRFPRFSHNPGLNTWEVAPLLSAINNFLKALYRED